MLSFHDPLFQVLSISPIAQAKKPQRSPLRLRFLACTLEEMSCAICITYFPTVSKKGDFGLQAAGEWNGAAVSSASHVVQMVEDAYRAALTFGGTLLLLDRYFLTVAAFEKLGALNRSGDICMEIWIRTYTCRFHGDYLDFVRFSAYNRVEYAGGGKGNHVEAT